MVSVNPNPFSQSFSFSSSSPSSFGPMKYSLPGIEHLPPPHTAASSGATTAIDVVAHGSSTASSEDPSKKIRKPYTITKSRESWTEQEHDKFLEALQLFDRDWKKIEAFVGSKSVIQIRSHAQKYFLKVQKNGATEHLPPPRPKRKAAHPYPQKASKNAPVVSKGVESFQSSAALLEPGYVLRPDSSSVLGNSNVALSSWTYNVPPVKMAHMEKDSKELLQPAYNYCCSSSSENPRGWAAGEANDEGNHNQQERVMPDFAQVYSFIGSVFDPDESDHLQKLKKMDPINVETVLLLMRNLSVNLTSPEFEDHRKLISSYGVKSHSAVSDGVQGNFCADKLENTISSA